ncbi:MAG: acetate/propionate family kinase [Pseudomonadota bacterium]|nr:acetate/propionate family kinase [Pseudomonadota bacterium]
MQHILTINAGSSSIKFALFGPGGEPVERVRGMVEELGVRPRFRAQAGGEVLVDRALPAGEVGDHAAALDLVLGLIGDRFRDAGIAGVGHRVVHGGPGHDRPALIDDRVLAGLEDLSPLAPLHQPHNLSGIRAARAAFPDAAQVACFDTAFHRTHAWTEDVFALPREFHEAGVRRYGFHGLSYEYVAGRLQEIEPAAARGKVIVCHLGNGASMCALHDGRSMASTMGFTALDGLAMGTRCGQIDPGVLLYLMQQRGMSPDEIEDLLYRRSGLLGLSGLSHDMRVLEQADSEEARRAIGYFIARARREIGALGAVLGGLDMLVFCAGIGENGAAVRASICRDFGWLGIELDETRNRAGEPVISAPGSRVIVRVVETDEEIMIARHTAALLAG